MLFNGSDEPIDFTIPAAQYSPRWDVVVDTAGHLADSGPRSGGDVIALDARSLVVLRDHEDDTPETDHSVAASLAALTTPIDLVPAQAPTVELPH